jgi:hypothetical protein
VALAAELASRRNELVRARRRTATDLAEQRAAACSTLSAECSPRSRARGCHAVAMLL